jgi:hypothetical protein
MLIRMAGRCCYTGGPHQQLVEHDVVRYFQARLAALTP